MGNNTSTCTATSAEEIEKWYAARAAEHAARSRAHSDESDQEELLPLLHSPESECPIPGDESVTPDVHPSEESTATNDANPADDARRTGQATWGSTPRSGVFRSTAATSNPFQTALRVVSNKVQVLASRAHDAVANAIKQLRELGVIGIAKEVGRWMKAHPAETVAIVVFIVVLASTPALLGAMGFTTAGIAAGSAAAGIQSGIGSVVAGSAFAICQSAMMGGYGMFIFAALPAVSSFLAWAGAALWTWWKGSGSTDGDGGPTDGDGGSTDGDGGSTDGDAVFIMTDTDKEVALVKPVVQTTSIAKELATDIGQVIRLGAIFVAATAVYRYRRWNNARQTDLST